MQKVYKISISKKRGTKKKNIDEAFLEEGYGIKGDAHAGGGGNGDISLLAKESIDKMIEMGLEVGPGDFAENLTTLGINLLDLKIGDDIKIGQDVILKVCKIGKTCHNRCEIYKLSGDCIMPKEGIFANVIKGGKIKEGDDIYL